MAAGAILGSPRWWGPWRSPRPPGKPSGWWKNSDPPSGGSENRLSVQQRKEQRKNGTGSSRNPGAPPADRFENPFPLQAVESPPETFPKPRSHHGCGMMLPRMSYRPDRDVAASRFRPWKSIVRSGERSTANDVGGGMTQADTDREIRARFDRQASATKQRPLPWSLPILMRKLYCSFSRSSEEPCRHGSCSSFRSSEELPCRIYHFRHWLSDMSQLGGLPVGSLRPWLWHASVCRTEARKTTSRRSLGDRKGPRGREYVLTSSNPVAPT